MTTPPLYAWVRTLIPWLFLWVYADHVTNCIYSLFGIRKQNKEHYAECTETRVNCYYTRIVLYINDKFIYSLQYILKYLNMNSTLIVRSAKFMGCLTYHTVWIVYVWKAIAIRAGKAVE